MLASTLWGLLASLLYHSVSEGVGGTSLGKLSLGYRVIGEDSKPCGFGAAALRSLAYFADAFFFGIPAYQSMKDNPNNQRLGDKWAKTIVIKASAAPASAVRSSGLVAVGLMGGMAAHVTVMAISVIAKVL